MEEKKSENEVSSTVAGEKRRKPRHFSAEEKLRLLAEAEQPGNSISLMARKHGIDANLMFRWRRHRDAGSLSAVKAGEAVVAESEVAKLKKQVKELQRMLGQKTEDLEILKAAIEVAREKKLLSPALLSKLEALL